MDDAARRLAGAGVVADWLADAMHARTTRRAASAGESTGSQAQPALTSQLADAAGAGLEINSAAIDAQRER